MGRTVELIRFNFRTDKIRQFSEVRTVTCWDQFSHLWSQLITGC